MGLFPPCLVACMMLATSLVAPTAAAQVGSLVIVGGGLEPGNSQVYEAFLQARPADARRIVIIPAASGEPALAADSVRKALMRHGAKEADITVIPLALIDDPSTSSVDESRWSEAASSADETARLGGAGAIWFTGGDQSRITGLLINTDGSDTPMLAEIRSRHAEGAVIGGTSAGAAIMSVEMITGGDSLGALLPGALGEEMSLARGLGFLKSGLVDQHFGQRARLGRLAAALMLLPEEGRVGFGIDEDTALVISGDQTQASVVGSGYVTVLDARSAQSNPAVHKRISGLWLSLAAHGDMVGLPDAEVTPAPFRKPTVGREYFDVEPVDAGGMAIAGSDLANVIGEGLLDNSAADQIVRHSFAGTAGVTYRFTQGQSARGWWGRDQAGQARYTADRVTFDILPISITIREAR